MIGDKLRKLRKEQGLTQRELADALGVHYTYISKIECNAARPGMQFVQNAARVLGVAPNDLLYPAVTRRPDGLVSVRIRSVVNVLTDEQALNLARELMRVATSATDEPCTQCEERPRMWVQGVHCGACESLREAFSIDEQHCDKCETAPRYDGPLCVGCLAAREGR